VTKVDDGTASFNDTLGSGAADDNRRQTRSAILPREHEFGSLGQRLERVGVDLKRTNDEQTRPLVRELSLSMFGRPPQLAPNESHGFGLRHRGLSVCEIERCLYLDVH
jgi:hypothetical protein